ncbi:hypothetical protein S40285_10618 [Stachybotrys chlorohalonatus IBT 40285]|uniref:Uncharacterized protein n=1 Tax=Stachybotrys chlorohalonatus (strain IBT 40285) TaxID=1283841 RepID=A0A084QSN7_STAC4|nr:hypothetical protein S40285_10618 [Stachybotrys chlorohalonata IBT 40285]
MTGVFITPDFKNNVKAFLKIVLLPKEVQDRRKPQQSVLKVPAVMEVVHALELTELLLNLNLCESRYLNELQHMIPAHEKVFAIFLASNYCLPQEISAPLHQLGYPNLLTWPSEWHLGVILGKLRAQVSRVAIRGQARQIEITKKQKILRNGNANP